MPLYILDSRRRLQNSGRSKVASLILTRRCAMNEKYHKIEMQGPVCEFVFTWPLCTQTLSNDTFSFELV